MANVKLMNFSASEISFINNVKKTERFDLNNRCSFNLGFAPGKLCRGEMTAEVTCKNDPSAFSVKVKVVGNFLREDENAHQDDVHRTCYKLLLPHVRAMITAVTVNANVPPIFFPDINIDGQSVYLVENPKK